MPQPRSRKRRNWPVGLYDSVVRGVTYYRWRHPATGKYHGLGSDFELAREAAVHFNAKLHSSPLERLVARVEGSHAGVTFGDACTAFMAVVATRKTGRGDDVKERSEATLKDYEGYLRRFKASPRLGGDTPLARLGLEQVAAYLDTYDDKLRARQYARGLLVQIWDVAVAKGWAPQNWAEQTLDLKPTVQRQRLTLEQFDAVVDASDPWFKAAAKFALYCDQRRSDVATVLASEWDGKTLTFAQEKTGNVVRIAAGPKLAEAIKDCLAVPAPKGTKVRTIIRHPTEGSVSADMLTRAWQRTRDELIEKNNKAWRGLRGKKNEPKRPTWHEVRSLGAHLAERAKKDAKALAGHATEQMGAMYQRGHAKTFEAESL